MRVAAVQVTSPAVMERAGTPLVLLALASLCQASQVRNVYWNTTTGMASKEPMVVTVNENNLPWEYDQVNLICPVVREGEREEQHVIYSVDKEEFETCRILRPQPRIIAQCTEPNKKK